MKNPTGKDLVSLTLPSAAKPVIEKIRELIRAGRAADALPCLAGGAYMVPPCGMPCVRGCGLQSRHASPAALLRVEPPAFCHCQLILV